MKLVALLADLSLPRLGALQDRWCLYRGQRNQAQGEYLRGYFNQTGVGDGWNRAKTNQDGFGGVFFFCLFLLSLNEVCVL